MCVAGVVERCGVAWQRVARGAVLGAVLQPGRPLRLPKQASALRDSFIQTFLERLATRAIRDPKPSVSRSAVRSILDSIVVSIPACHAGGRGSIPRQGVFLLTDVKFFFFDDLLSHLDACRVLARRSTRRKLRGGSARARSRGARQDARSSRFLRRNPRPRLPEHRQASRLGRSRRGLLPPAPRRERRRRHEHARARSKMLAPAEALPATH